MTSRRISRFIEQKLIWFVSAMDRPLYHASLFGYDSVLHAGKVPTSWGWSFYPPHFWMIRRCLYWD
jgi:hypothetical protein